MVQINFARREVNCKIVYYGPGLSGKTTNLELIHKKAANVAGQLTSVATDEDRTLFFDFMPVDIGTVAGMKTKLALYTVPGQVYYNSTRKLVLQGADGVVFVADSDPARLPDNVDSLSNLIENLKEYNLELGRIPFVIQFNKRDLPGALPVVDLAAKLNRWNAPTFEAVAVKGDGVMQTLKAIAKMIIDRLNEDYGAGRAPLPAAGATAAPAAAAKPAARSAPAPAASRMGPAPAARPAAAAASQVRPTRPTAPAVTPAMARPATPPAAPRRTTAAHAAPPAGRFGPPRAASPAAAGRSARAASGSRGKVVALVVLLLLAVAAAGASYFYFMGR